MKKIIIFLLLVPALSCSQKNKKKHTQKKVYIVNKTDTEWKKILSKEEYKILRKSGTESAYSGEYNNHFKKGIYACKACNSFLYKSENKFDSKTGWPSFDSSIENTIEYQIDYKFGFIRTEVKCIKCGSHLGHVFNDGPKETTGKRHCINSIALNFISE